MRWASMVGDMRRRRTRRAAVGARHRMVLELGAWSFVARRPPCTLQTKPAQLMFLRNFFQQFEYSAPTRAALSSGCWLGATISLRPVRSKMSTSRKRKGWEDDLRCICQCKMCLLAAEPYIDELQRDVPPLLPPRILKWSALRKNHVRFYEGSADDLRVKSYAAWCLHTGKPSELAAAGEPSTGIAPVDDGEAFIKWHVLPLSVTQHHEFICQSLQAILPAASTLLHFVGGSRTLQAVFRGPFGAILPATMRRIACMYERIVAAIAQYM